jgi:hypothetical protein
VSVKKEQQAGEIIPTCSKERQTSRHYLLMGPKSFRHILACPRCGVARWDASKAYSGRPKNSPSRLTLGLRQFGTLVLRFANNHRQQASMALGQSKYVYIKMHVRSVLSSHSLRVTLFANHIMLSVVTREKRAFCSLL